MSKGERKYSGFPLKVSGLFEINTNLIYVLKKSFSSLDTPKFFFPLALSLLDPRRREKLKLISNLP